MADAHIHTCFRPGIFSFINKVQQFAKIILITLATKCYAEVIRKVLDPGGDIIINLITRED